MRKGERAEFSAKWWRGSEPDGLATSSKLEAALKRYESARAKLEANGKRDALEPATDALDDVAAAIRLVVAEAGKAKNNPEMDATVQALTKLDLRKERAAIAELVKEGDGEDEADEDDAEGLADSAEYNAYLLKAMKKLRNGAMNFGLCLGSKPDAHRLVLHRRKAPKTLAMHMAKELKLRHFSFGVAMPSEERPQTILLNVQGHLLPGMRKRTERMLKEFKPLPFFHVALFVGGQEIDEPEGAEDEGDEGEGADDAPDQDGEEADRELDEKDLDEAHGEDFEEPEAHHDARSASAPVRLKQDMKALDPELRAVFRRRSELRGPIVAAVSAFVAALRGGDLPTAQAKLDSVKGIIAPHRQAEPAA